MLKYFFLALLLVILGANTYFFRSPSEELSSDAPEYQTKEEILNDPELSQGMEKILENNQSEERVEAPEENFIEDNDILDGGRETDLRSFRKQGRKAEKKAFLKVHRDDIRILERELVRDHEILSDHMKEGNEDHIRQMREQIIKKQELLDYLQNNPPEEENYDQ